MLDLNTMMSLSLEDLLIVFLLRHMRKKDVATGLSISRSAVSQHLEKIARYLDLSTDSSGRLNYKTYEVARRIVCQARKSDLILKEVRRKVREKEERCQMGYLKE